MAMTAEQAKAMRGLAIPGLRRADDAVWAKVRALGIRPGEVFGHKAFDTSQALRAAESVARSLPIDPTGL